MEDKFRAQYLRRNIISILIILGVILIGLIVYKVITREPETDLSAWENVEYGDIVINTVTEETEVLPENIFDAYGLEYEFVKLPSVGISTYKPVEWDVMFDNEFFYFTAPDDDEKYKHIEIGICVASIGNINDTYERTFVQNYMHENLKNHNKMKLGVSLITNKSYIAIKDGGDLFAYYATPEIEFRREDDPSKGGWNPYSVVYMLNTDSDITTFCCVSGPRNYIDSIDEIAKTLAYNTVKYTNTKFDFKELIDVHMKRVKVNGISYMVKDSEDTDDANNAVSPLLVESTSSGYYHTLSSKISSLAFNEKLVVESHAADKDIDDFVDYSFMDSAYKHASSIYSNGSTDIERKGLESPKYTIDTTEKLAIANKEARKVIWRADCENDSTGRSRTSSIMPKMFTTYLVHNGNAIYSFTIDYTKYQKYAANEYIDKTVQTIGFDSN